MDDIDSWDADAGRHLQAWREYRGMTQEELAEQVGTYSGQISLLENGKRQLTVRWLHKLADALQIAPGWLLDHHPREINPEIYDIWYRIPDAKKQLARDVLFPFQEFPQAPLTD